MKATVAIVTIGALLSTSFTSASPVPETAQVEKRCSPFDTTPTYYADGKQINYSKGWTILKNQGSRDKNGTEAYSGDACAYVALDDQLLARKPTRLARLSVITRLTTAFPTAA